MSLRLGGPVNSHQGLKALNEYLSNHSYIEGYTPSQSDVVLFDELKSFNDNQYPHVLRWFKHLSSFNQQEKTAFAGVKKSLDEFGVCENGTSSAGVSKADDDDDVDLFGSDEDEEAEKAKAERVKAYQEKKSKKPGVIAKSSVLLDVKPWDDETDMKEMELEVRKIACDGLTWGASKLAPLAYGINKLQIICVVEDEKVSIDWLQEEIEKIESLVQSVDVAAFQKI
jgi:hypothetical protein